MSPLTCQLLLNFQAQVGKSFLHLNKKNSLRIPPSYMSIGRCSRVNFSRAATRARGKTRRCTAACSHEVWRWKVTNAYDYKAKCVYDRSKKSLWVAIMNRHELLARPISNDPKHVHFQHFAWAKVQHAVLEMPLVCTSVWWTTCGSKVLSPASIRSRAWICESCFSQITLHISLYTSLYDLAISVAVTADIYRFYRLLLWILMTLYDSCPMLLCTQHGERLLQDKSPISAAVQRAGIRNERFEGGSIQSSWEGSICICICSPHILQFHAKLMQNATSFQNARPAEFWNNQLNTIVFVEAQGECPEAPWRARLGTKFLCHLQSFYNHFNHFTNIYTCCFWSTLWAPPA